MCLFDSVRLFSLFRIILNFILHIQPIKIKTIFVYDY